MRLNMTTVLLLACRSNFHFEPPFDLAGCGEQHIACHKTCNNQTTTNPGLA